MCMMRALLDKYFLPHAKHTTRSLSPWSTKLWTFTSHFEGIFAPQSKQGIGVSNNTEPNVSLCDWTCLWKSSTESKERAQSLQQYVFTANPWSSLSPESLKSSCFIPFPKLAMA